MSRYARQTCLPEFGESGQEKLRRAKVAVIGAGGLGAPVLQYLVGAGIGRISVIDGDIVSASNLHRQTLFREANVGKSKAIAAAETLANLNAECRIDAIEEPLNCDNIGALLGGADVVLDCADSFAASYIASDFCFAENTALISASVLGFGGYVGGFCGGAPSLRAVFPDLPARAATCATAGVLGPVVGIVGSLQATMALNFLLGLSPSPLGQIMTIDAQNYRFSGFRFDTAPEPEGNPLRFMSPAEITNTDTLIELRGTDEAPDPFHPDAIRAVVDTVTNAVLPAHGERVVLACRSGLRAWQAARRLEAAGHHNFGLIALGAAPKSLSTDGNA